MQTRSKEPLGLIKGCVKAMWHRFTRLTFRASCLRLGNFRTLSSREVEKSLNWSAVCAALHCGPLETAPLEGFDPPRAATALLLTVLLHRNLFSFVPYSCSLLYQILKTPLGVGCPVVFRYKYSSARFPKNDRSFFGTNTSQHDFAGSLFGTNTSQHDFSVFYYTACADF